MRENESFIYMEPSEEGVASITETDLIRGKTDFGGLRGPLIGIAIGNHLDGRESGWAG